MFGTHFARHHQRIYFQFHASLQYQYHEPRRDCHFFAIDVFALFVFIDWYATPSVSEPLHITAISRYWLSSFTTIHFSGCRRPSFHDIGDISASGYAFSTRRPMPHSSLPGMFSRVYWPPPGQLNTAGLRRNAFMRLSTAAITLHWFQPEGGVNRLASLMPPSSELNAAIIFAITGIRLSSLSRALSVYFIALFRRHCFLSAVTPLHIARFAYHAEFISPYAIIISPLERFQPSPDWAEAFLRLLSLASYQLADIFSQREHTVNTIFASCLFSIHFLPFQLSSTLYFKSFLLVVFRAPYIYHAYNIFSI